MYDEDDWIGARLRRHGRCRCLSWRPYRSCCWEREERRWRRDRRSAEAHERVCDAARERGVNVRELVRERSRYERFAAEVGVALPTYDDEGGDPVDDEAKYEDVDEWLKDAGPLMRERARDASLPRHLQALPTDQLVVELWRAGLPVDPGAFRAASRRTTSAWALGARWRADLERAGVRLRGLGARPHFVEFASCALWERFVPERLSQEQVEDLFGLGRVAVRPAGTEADALEHWRRAWSTFERWLHPEVDTIDAARLAFAGARDALFHYVDALTEVLFRFARQGHETNQVRLADAVDLMDRFVHRFRGEPPALRAELEADLAEVHFRTGARNVAEVILARQRLDRPTHALGYVRHALLLSETWDGAPAPTQVDRSRALALLDRARERPVEDAREWDLDARITAARLWRRYEPPRDLPPARPSGS